MTQQGGLITDRLYFIIQTIQLGQKTGMLRARRENNTSIEEGSIAFYQGQVLTAHVGQQTGTPAFNTLTGWGACQYSFEPGSSAIKSVLVRLPPQTSFTQPFSKLTTNKIPAMDQPIAPSQRQQTNKIPAIDQPIAPSQRQQTNKIPAMDQPIAPSQRQQTNKIPAMDQLLTPLQSQQIPVPDKPTAPLPNQQTFAPDDIPPDVDQQLLSSQILEPALIPHMIMPLNIALTIANELNFSRSHRQVLILINGQRTVEDIIRLTGRSPQYVSSMLLELERAGALRLQY